MTGVDQEQLLEARSGQAVAVAVPLEEEELVPVDGRQLAVRLATGARRSDGVGIGEGAVRPAEHGEVHLGAGHLEADDVGIVAPPPAPDVEREHQHVLRVVVADGALEQGVQRPAVRADRQPLEASTRRHVRLLAGGHIERRVLRRLDPRRGDRWLEQFAGAVDVQEERSELVAEPECAVVSDLHRLGVEVEPGEEPGSWIAAARRRRHAGHDVDRQVRQRCTGAVAHDLPGHVPIGIVQHGGRHHLRCRLPEVRRDAIDRQLVVGRVLPRAVAVVGQGPPCALAGGNHRTEALHRLVGEIGVARPTVRNHVVGRVRAVLLAEERAGRRRARADRGRREHASIDQPAVLLALALAQGAGPWAGGDSADHHGGDDERGD